MPGAPAFPLNPSQLQRDPRFGVSPPPQLQLQPQAPAAGGVGAPRDRAEVLPADKAPSSAPSAPLSHESRRRFPALPPGREAPCWELGAAAERGDEPGAKGGRHAGLAARPSPLAWPAHVGRFCVCPSITAQINLLPTTAGEAGPREATACAASLLAPGLAEVTAAPQPPRWTAPGSRASSQPGFGAVSLVFCPQGLSW